MLILSVFIFLVIAGWVILLVHKLNKRSGVQWLIALLVSLFSFIFWVAIGIIKPAPAVFDLSQLPFGIPAEISFTMDPISRGIGVLLLAYQVYIVNSWMVKLEDKRTFRRIKDIFLLSAVSLCLISADSLFTWIVILIIFDLVDLIYLFRHVHAIQSPKQYFSSTLINIAGTLVFFLGWVLSINLTSVAVISLEFLYAGLLIRLFGSFLRWDKPTQPRSSFETYEEFYYLILPILVFFIRYPIGSVLPLWMQYGLWIIVLLMLYHLVEWVRAAKRSISIYHSYAFIVLFLLVYLQAGTPSGFIAILFCLTLILVTIYFRPIPHPLYLWFVLPSFGLFIGLPYLPTATIFVLSNPAYTGMFLMYFVLLLAFGKQYHIHQPEKNNFERWMKVMYPIGFLPFLIGLVYLVLLRDLPILAGNYVLSGLFSVILLALMIYAILRKKNVISEIESLQWIKPVAGLLWSRVKSLIEKRWIERMLHTFFLGVNRLLDFLNHIMEGDGALLWAIVFLILFLSILRT